MFHATWLYVIHMGITRSLVRASLDIATIIETGRYSSHEGHIQLHMYVYTGYIKTDLNTPNPEQ